MIKVTDNQFNSSKNWSIPLEHGVPTSIIDPDWLEYFDQNGYRLTRLESHYADANGYSTVNHRYEVCLRQDWYTGDKVLTGPHLNHAYLFERKGYEGAALDQLKEYAEENNLINKLIKYKGKWGVDFSIDYVDNLGNSMELLHFEYDSFNYNEIQDIKGRVEDIVKEVDWEMAAKTLLKRKDEWFSEDYFKQSKWKTDFFKLPAEQFKMIGWE